ncbi:MAG: hypothetical protein ACI9TA_001442 [Reinekea sp.]
MGKQSRLASLFGQKKLTIAPLPFVLSTERPWVSWQ